MRTRLDRERLLAEIDAEYASLIELIGRVASADLMKSKVNSAGWSLKDVLAHVADWAERCEHWCRAGLRGESPRPPAPGFKWSETARLNHEIFLRRRGHTTARVMRDFHAGHKALLKLVRSLDEADLCEPNRFIWTGPAWSVAKHIRANTAAHYRWAGKHFKKWLRTAGPAKPASAARLRASTGNPTRRQRRTSPARRRSARS